LATAKIEIDGETIFGKMEEKLEAGKKDLEAGKTYTVECLDKDGNPKSI
jgi:hypothetical protein